MMLRTSRPCSYSSLMVLAAAIGSWSHAAERPRFEIAYATYLGGGQWDQAREAIPYPDGSVLIGAQTSSVDMPTSADAVQPHYAGDDPNLGHGGVYGGDCYLARLSPNGRQILAATYFGGSKQERNVYGMALDREGNIVITSMTRSRDVPITAGCFQPKHGGGSGGVFAAKLEEERATGGWRSSTRKPRSFSIAPMLVETVMIWCAAWHGDPGENCTWSAIRRPKTSPFRQVLPKNALGAAMAMPSS